MKTIKGFHGKWNMGSPGGWDYQRVGQLLGKMAWDLILENIEVGVDIVLSHPQINAIPGFARMLLRIHKNIHGGKPVHVVLLAETENPGWRCDLQPGASDFQGEGPDPGRNLLHTSLWPGGNYNIIDVSRVFLRQCTERFCFS